MEISKDHDHVDIPVYLIPRPDGGPLAVIKKREIPKRVRDYMHRICWVGTCPEVPEDTSNPYGYMYLHDYQLVCEGTYRS